MSSHRQKMVPFFGKIYSLASQIIPTQINAIEVILCYEIGGVRNEFLASFWHHCCADVCRDVSIDS